MKKSFFRYARLFLISAALIALSACGRVDPSQPAMATPPPAASPQPVHPSVLTELEKRAEVERQLRLKTETRLAEQESARSRWQSGALLAVTAAVILLLAGTILGTRARHDAQKP